MKRPITPSQPAEIWLSMATGLSATGESTVLLPALTEEEAKWRAKTLAERPVGKDGYTFSLPTEPVRFVSEAEVARLIAEAVAKARRAA